MEVGRRLRRSPAGCPGDGRGGGSQGAVCSVSAGIHPTPCWRPAHGVRLLRVPGLASWLPAAGWGLPSSHTTPPRSAPHMVSERTPGVPADLRGDTWPVRFSRCRGAQVCGRAGRRPGAVPSVAHPPVPPGPRPRGDITDREPRRCLGPPSSERVGAQLGFGLLRGPGLHSPGLPRPRWEPSARPAVPFAPCREGGRGRGGSWLGSSERGPAVPSQAALSQKPEATEETHVEPNSGPVCRTSGFAGSGPGKNSLWVTPRQENRREWAGEGAVRFHFPPLPVWAHVCLNPPSPPPRPRGEPAGRRPSGQGPARRGMAQLPKVRGPRLPCGQALGGRGG